MHVIFTSNCIARAKSRTRKVLDSYALRISNDTWSTPITHEILKVIYKALKAKATKNTSVSCFVNDGRTSMKLLWTVGNKSMKRLNGQYPVKTMKYHTPDVLSDILRIMCLVAKASGYGHDLGKVTQHFQNKLKNGSLEADPTRHEWISMKLMQELRKGCSWVDAWNNIKGNINQEDKIMKDGVKNYKDAIDMCVATHHGLFRNKDKGFFLSLDRHVRDKAKAHSIISPAGGINNDILNTISNSEKRLEKKVDEMGSDLPWQQMTLISRAMLIMADHTISSVKRLDKDAILYANTSGVDLNQDLNWHLQNVGETAALYLKNLFTENIQGIGENTIQRILAPSDGRFSWQNDAVDTARDSNQNALVFVTSSTGSGKTMGNVKICAALNIDNPHGLRFSTGLNLRTLTLQTGDAYNKDLKLDKSQYSVLIGDKIVKELHRQATIIDTDENELENDFEIQGGDDTELPEWLNSYCSMVNGRANFLATPVLVSTIDYIINAGVPYKQKHHPLALLRVATSDLILDEIDGYEPRALIAVCRIVELAAMFGRSVICSSATLSKHVADTIFKAFKRGNDFRNLIIENESKPRVMLVNDSIPSKNVYCNDMNHFREEYSNYIKNIMETIDNRYRIAKLLHVNGDEEAWKKAIHDQSISFHNDHKWEINEGQFISFGFVRIANIKVAVPLARYLANKFNEAGTNAYIMCYHANDLRIQRYMKEQTLDNLLNRKKGNEHIKHDEDIKNKVGNKKDTIFVVVATPVEEIGRDHDFDWHIIEPSSIQSVIQSSGRVDRHRLIEIASPNIAILQYNWREIDGQDKVFYWPGYEKKISFKYTHKSHDIKDLIKWDENENSPVDVRLRFDSKFAEYDDKSIRDTLQKGENIFFQNTRAFVWGNGVYNTYTLRDNDDQETWRLNGDLNYERYEFNKRQKKWVTKKCPFSSLAPMHPNSWGAYSLQDLYEISKSKLKDPKSGMEFTIKAINGKYIFDESFGFYNK